MSEFSHPISRRTFCKTAALAGLSAAALPWSAPAESAPGAMPRRILGRSGRSIPILSLGGMFDIWNSQHLLHRARQLGVTGWDTADCYEGGRSEPGFGRYFEEHPEARPEIFLITKSDARDPEGLTRLLQRSLERLKTSFIDLYLIHDLRSPEEITDALREWVVRAKGEGHIRLFGFSTHRNMEEHLAAAAKKPEIDAVMTSCNFRLLQSPGYRDALKACAEAGVGVVAMKTQGGGSLPAGGDAESRIAEHFMGRGFSERQARLKAVWENPHVSAICSQMPRLSILSANTAAAMDRTSLDEADRQTLRTYEAETAATYCAGCERFCSAALAESAPVADVMRFLMYARSYERPDLGKSRFLSLAPERRAALARTNFRAAEAACPRRLPIARLVDSALAMWG